jgi:pyridoxal phosphate enzyme (YggS family)
MSTLKSRYHSILQNLSGRAQLIAVSKTYSIEKIHSLYELGQRHFGENRVQELMEKSQMLARTCPEICWHMIGPLQSNKINQLFKVENLYAIHSVDRLELIESIEKKKLQNSRPIKIFIQINTSHEEQKHGFSGLDNLAFVIETCKKITGIKLVGFMTMATYRTEDKAGEARRCFADLKQLALKFQPINEYPLELSMGMSDDYQYALEYGTDWVRIGSAIFRD